MTGTRIEICHLSQEMDTINIISAFTGSMEEEAFPVQPAHLKAQSQNEEADYGSCSKQE